MKSFDRVGVHPVSLPLVADDLVEFHAARILLLVSICGVAGRIDGLTKMAKLDFFVRYPSFFEVAKASLEEEKKGESILKGHEIVEATMVRHHYGPWDKRYYQVLAYLEAKGLITVAKYGISYRIALTSLGGEKVKLLRARASFGPLVARMSEVKMAFGSKGGTFLKNLIYRIFDAEVGQLPMGEVIHA